MIALRKPGLLAEAPGAHSISPFEPRIRNDSNLADSIRQPLPVGHLYRTPPLSSQHSIQLNRPPKMDRTPPKVLNMTLEELVESASIG